MQEVVIRVDRRDGERLLFRDRKRDRAVWCKDGGGPAGWWIERELGGRTIAEVIA
jgi:hypothetical protein